MLIKINFKSCMLFLLLVFLLGKNIFAQDWKCIIYGDTRNDRTEHRQVLESITQNTPDYKFIINVGDVVDHGDREYEWNDWQNTVTSVLGTTGQDMVPPLYMATPGNHDATETTKGLNNWMKYLSGQNLLYCTDDINESSGKYFTFDHENVRFIILDSDKSDTEGEQYQMLLNSLAENPQQWIIAIWHDPIFSFGEKSYEEEFNRLWGTELYKYGADFIFCGDAHYYVRSKKLALNGDKHPPIDEESGITHIVTGNGGAPIDVPDITHDGNEYLVAGHATNSSHYGYTELHFKNDSLYLTHYLRDGNILDEAVYSPNKKNNTVSVEEDISLKDVNLFQSYPNPFNNSTVIKFNLNESTQVNLAVYNLEGKKVKSLVSNKFYAPGTYEVRWDAKNENDQVVANGVYYYRLETKSQNYSLKTILLK